MAIYKAQTKLENYIDFQDTEPKNPVKGQKYYDGDKVVTWTGSEWKTVVNPTKLEKDVANAAQAGEDAGKKADDAKNESDKAVKHANQIAKDTEEQLINIKGDILLRVKSDEIINQINVSKEGILIDGAKTHITGKTTIDEGVISTAHIKDAAITSAKIKSITAGKIEAGTVKGLVLSSESATGKFNVEGQRAVFENTDTSERTELSDSGLIVYDRNRNMKSQITQQMVNSSYFGTSNVNTYITVGSLSTGDDMAEEGSGEFRIVDYDPRMAKENGMGDGRDDYTYLNVRANALFANVIRVNYADRKDGVVNNHLYLQPRWGYEIRLTAPGTTAGNSVYQDLRAKDLYANVLQSNSADGDDHVYIRPNNSGELRVMNPDNTSFRNVRANDMYIRNIVKPAEGDLYIGTSGKVRIMGRGLWEDSNYRPIVSSAFQNPSLETFKTNIRRYEDSALSIIDNAEIYNYELKSDVKEGKNEIHTGLIIGDDYQTPDCIKSDDNSAIDLYAMSSMGWKAIQELSEKIKDLRSEMDLLRRELNNE